MKLQIESQLTSGQIPLASALVALTKVFFEREMAISERSIKPGSVLHDTSHILGKYEIHVLPEG